MDVFTNLAGGVERLSFVTRVLDGNLAVGTILRMDTARAYSAYVTDNSQLDFARCGEQCSAAEKEGFVWIRYFDEEGGPEFAKGDDKKRNSKSIHAISGKDASENRGIGRSEGMSAQRAPPRRELGRETLADELGCRGGTRYLRRCSKYGGHQTVRHAGLRQL